MAFETSLADLTSFSISIPAYQALPEFLRQTKFQTPSGSDCAWQHSVKTSMDFFPYYKQHLEQLSNFQKLTSAPRDGDWFDVVPLAEDAANVSSDHALFVEIGGGIGPQCKRLRTKYPSLPGRVIVQDLPEKIQVATPAQGVEFMTYDLFSPQPVHGKLDIYSRFPYDAESLICPLQARDSTTCETSSMSGMRRNR